MQNQSDELYHYGVPGMKWGVRRASNSSNRAKAKQQYKDAKKNYWTARRSKGGLIGIEGIAKSQAKQNRVNEASMNVISKKAAYNASKAKTKDKAKKAEFKTYRKEMQKTGLAGSALDQQSGGRSTQIYNKMKAEKGKAYADSVQKSVQNHAYAQVATSATVAVGSYAVAMYLAYKG